MKIIVTTSNKYLHILPIFCHLFNKYWDSKQQVEIVGYDKPTIELPINFNFVSLGKQTDDKQNFTRDLRKYFSKQNTFFFWFMEDTFIKAPVDFRGINYLKSLTEKIPNVGRINLTGEVLKQDNEYLTTIDGRDIYKNNKYSLYRLSTQPSIWNKYFALQYMVEDLSPWEFECQSDHATDDFQVIGLADNIPFKHNEGVRKYAIHDFNLEGIEEATIQEMKTLKIIS
jgi:hypothetical protein